MSLHGSAFPPVREDGTEGFSFVWKQLLPVNNKPVCFNLDAAGEF